MNIPEHPEIALALRTGYPKGKAPAPPHCPVCGEECEMIYRDWNGIYVGCDICLEVRDAWKVPDCFDNPDAIYF